MSQCIKYIESYIHVQGKKCLEVKRNRSTKSAKNIISITVKPNPREDEIIFSYQKASPVHTDSIPRMKI